VADHRLYYLRDLIDTVLYIENGKITGEYTREQFCNLDKMSQIQKGLRPVYPEKEICISEKSLNDSAQKTDNIFKVENLSFGYDKNVNILNNVSLEASSGDVIGIIGHNGAGKTTLISVLIGILKEKNGRVLYNGKKINPIKRRKLSYLVMQDADYQLFTASVEDELTLGISKPDKTKVDDILNRLNLSKYIDRHPASLSGGQKQRVTIGTSLMKECKILYFDEPTSGLDFDSMNRVSRMIKSLADDGAIIFLVSHDFEFITNTCNKLFDFDIESVNQMIEVNKENTEKFAVKYFDAF
jgi:energy-coupling factor transport system ATP-binding protein